MIMETLSQSEGLNRIPITVNYDEPKAIIRAIEAAKFGRRHLESKLEEIPLVGSGKVRLEVRAVRLGQAIFNRNLSQALKRHGKKLTLSVSLQMADPLTFLRYVGANSGRLHKLAIIFTNTVGQLCAFHAYDHVIGMRVLHFRQTSPEGFWSEDIRFLAVVC